MGSTDNIMRDLSLLIAAGVDTIESDVKAFIFQTTNEIDQIEKWFSSNSSAALFYVVNMETKDVIEMYEGSVRSHIGNLLDYTEIELTEAEAQRNECLSMPDYVDLDWLMEETIAGGNPNLIKNSEGVLGVRIGRCFVPFRNEGTQEAIDWYAKLKAGAFGGYELEEGAYSDETPEAFTGELEVQTASGRVYLWRNERWINEETGAIDDYDILTMQGGDKLIEAPPGVDLRTGEEFTHSGQYYHDKSGKWWKRIHANERDDYGYVLTTDTNAGILYLVEPGAQPAAESEPSTTEDPTPGTVPTSTGSPIVTTGGGAGGRTGGGTSSSQTDIGAQIMANMFTGASQGIRIYPPEPLEEAFRLMGWSNGVTVGDLISMFMMSLFSAFARISNEPVDRAIRREMNTTAPNTIPGSSDLVRMELREVFRAADRAAALSVPPSETFTAFMEEWGYDKFWSDSYWAAHWELPSPLMGYDMFHRLRPDKYPEGISFDRDQLWNLLKILDYRPDFIDRLIELSYQPLTRVDVRRMYDLGVIPDYDSLVGCYLDLGYSPENADLMAQFTERYNEPAEKAPTKAFFEKEFKEGRLAYSELIKAYMMVGYNEYYSRLMADSLMTSMQKKEEQERKRRETGGRTDKMLSPEKALKAFSLGIIDEETCRHKIIRYGYDSVDTEIMIAIEKTGLAE